MARPKPSRQILAILVSALLLVFALAAEIFMIHSQRAKADTGEPRGEGPPGVAMVAYGPTTFEIMDRSGDGRDPGLAQPPPGAASPRADASPGTPGPEKAEEAPPSQYKIAAIREEARRLYKSGKVQKAIDKLHEAVVLDPDDEVLARDMSNLMAEMGWLHFRDKNHRKARGFFKESLHYWTENADAMRGLGFALYNLRDVEMAEKWLDNYIALGGARPDAYSLKARICYDSNRLEEARKYFEMSLSIDPEQPAVAEMAAKIRRELAAEEGFFEASTSHFIVKYEGYELPAVSKIVMIMCEEAYIEVGRSLGYYPAEPVTVLLYTNEQFQDVTRSPSWAGAIFDGKIRVPAKGLGARDGVLERVVLHEYTHAVVHDLARGRAPVWLHEGLAQSSEGDHYGRRALAKAVVAAGGPWPLDAMSGSFLQLPPAKARLAYAQSYLAVDYLGDDYGPYAVRELLRKLGNGDSIETAIEGVTYKRMDGFESGFEDWVKEAAAP